MTDIGNQPDRHVAVDLHFRQIRSPAHELAKGVLHIMQARVFGSVPLGARVVFELSRVTAVILEIERWRASGCRLERPTKPSSAAPDRASAIQERPRLSLDRTLYRDARQRIQEPGLSIFAERLRAIGHRD